MSNYYTKSEVDDIGNELSILILSTDTKTEVDNFLYTSYPSLSFIVDNLYSKTEIDLTLNDYTTPAQLHTDFDSEVQTNMILDACTTTTQLYDGFYSKGDTDTLLTDKVSATGNASLPGHLDIGTTYTSSRIRCNAGLGGYTGYAELKAESNYDMFLNLSATRTDGGWMYFKIDNDDYMQSPGGDNKVAVYKDTTISVNLDVGSGASSKINVHAANNGYTEYAELKAQSSYDMFLNLQTTRVNGVWVYHNINSGNYLLLSGSGQFVKHCKPLVASSGDKLEENELIIESACET